MVDPNTSYNFLPSSPCGSQTLLKWGLDCSGNYGMDQCHQRLSLWVALPCLKKEAGWGPWSCSSAWTPSGHVFTEGLARTHRFSALMGLHLFRESPGEVIWLRLSRLSLILVSRASRIFVLFNKGHWLESGQDWRLCVKCKFFFPELWGLAVQIQCALGESQGESHNHDQYIINYPHENLNSQTVLPVFQGRRPVWIGQQFTKRPGSGELLSWASNK